MSKKKCFDCRYWFEAPYLDPPEEMDRRECRRYPPVIVLAMIDSSVDAANLDLDSNVGEWPETRGTQWCGEWAAREDEE